MREILQVADVITLVFEAAPVLVTEDGDDSSNVAERVLEHVVFRAAQVRFLPVVLPRLITIDQLKEAKFMLPMLSEHISGRSSAGARSRSSTVIDIPPPVVTLITAFVPSLSRGRNAR